VLLRDAHVDEAVGEAFLERQQTGGAGHGGGDGDEFGACLALLDHGFGEGGGVAGSAGPLGLRAELGVEDARGVVEVLLLILLGRRVALALLGEDVDHDRTVELGGVAERFFQPRNVVAVERAAVADAERLEEDRRLEHLAQPGSGTGEAPGHVLADHGDLADDLLGPTPLA
jgi:hypothetical protein